MNCLDTDVTIQRIAMKQGTRNTKARKTTKTAKTTTTKSSKHTPQGMLQISFGAVKDAYRKAIKKAERAGAIQQVMQRRPDVFTRNKSVERLIANRLGWVDSASLMRRRVGAIEKFGNAVLADGIKHVVLMGMGGSSLCPEMFGLMFGGHPKLKTFSVVDSTDPAAVQAVTRKIEPTKSLFIVASKSGGTVETRSHEAHFIGLLKDAGVTGIGRHFVAITDPGSGLQAFAKKNHYRKTFLNPADIGGRYSALSYFGLVPAFFAGVDLKRLLDDAVMMQLLLLKREGETNPAAVLGSLMAAAAKSGRDKMTFVTSRKAAPLVPWIEQLVAESTGKRGKGVVPIEAEPSGKPTAYGKDRFFRAVKDGPRTHTRSGPPAQVAAQRRLPGCAHYSG